MVSFRFWKNAPPVKADDKVEYRGSFFKDGTFELEFVIEVPEVIWKIAVQKKTGRNPPPVVEVDRKILDHVDVGMLKGVFDKISEDIRKKTGRNVKLYPSKIDKMTIRAIGSHKYQAQVRVSGAWSE